LFPQLTFGQSLQLRGRRSDTPTDFGRSSSEFRSPPRALVGTIRLFPLRVRQQGLPLGSHFGRAEALLGLAEDGTEFDRAVLNRRPGHVRRDVLRDIGMYSDRFVDYR
jgi:hypothetical protein